MKQIGGVAMRLYCPDLQHIEVIRKALWTRSERGRAAVMVGSGMSRNAESTLPGRNLMPTWRDLILTLIGRLYPDTPENKVRRERLKNQADATSTAMRLADEFVAAHGRPALDDLILEMVPDSDVEPGELHRLLLELPWADLLTTNYDTLLERAAASVVAQRYCLVQAPEEIFNASRPRIVKLHGSFPSTRPFILTEEDFRTYLRRFAPYVNLAQQVIMESVLCLVGFSGDDPNFLHWTGWVRDNLAEYAPTIYLCGLLDLSDSQRRLLHKRNVTPIDLTPLFPIKDTPDVPTRHYSALKWFLLSLRNGRPYRWQHWPTSPSTGNAPTSRLPQLVPSSNRKHATN